MELARADLREAGILGVYAAASVYLLYFAAIAAGALILIIPDKSPSIANLVLAIEVLARHDNPVLPPPTWVLATSIGAICALTWLSGPFWYRRCGRRRHGDPEFYARPENFVRRCRLLGAIAGLPACIAAFVYYTVTPAFPAMAVYAGYWILRALGAIGPAIALMIQTPRFIVYYFIKGGVFLAFLAAPFAISAAIGAGCGWFYGRFARPFLRLLWPGLPPPA